MLITLALGIDLEPASVLPGTIRIAIVKGKAWAARRAAQRRPSTDREHEAIGTNTIVLRQAKLGSGEV